MKKSELIFGRFAGNPIFIRDINSFLDISKDKLDNALNIFLKSKYRAYYHNYIEEFSEVTKLPEETAHTLIHVIDLFAYAIVPHYETKEILSGLNELLKEKQVEKFRWFITKLKDEKVQNDLEILDLIDDEVGTINPHYRGLKYNLQDRIILKDDNIVKKMPVITLQFVTSERKDKNILELLSDDLDSLIRGLNKIKEKIKHLEGDRNESRSQARPRSKT